MAYLNVGATKTNSVTDRLVTNRIRKSSDGSSSGLMAYAPHAAAGAAALLLLFAVTRRKRSQSRAEAA